MCTDCQKQHGSPGSWGGLTGSGGKGQRSGGLGCTHHSLGQDECQILQVVLVAQGPRREGCKVWGSHRSQTLAEIVLESGGGQYGSQLEKSKLVQI